MPDYKRIAIIGGGRVGEQVARTLSGQGHNVVVIETDESVCSGLSERLNITVINGDGTDRTVLEQVPISDTDVLLAVSGKTSVNLSACLITKSLNPDVRTVLRVEEVGKREQYESMVDTVIFPEKIAGEKAANTVQQVVDTSGSLFGKGNLTFTAVEVNESAPAAGKTVKSLSVPEDTRIVAGDDQIVDGDTVIESDKRYIVISRADNADDILQFMRG